MYYLCGFGIHTCRSRSSFQTNGSRIKSSRLRWWRRSKVSREIFQAAILPSHRNCTARHIKTPTASSRTTASANRHMKAQYRSSFVTAGADLCSMNVMVIQTSQGIIGGKKKPKINSCWLIFWYSISALKELSGRGKMGRTVRVNGFHLGGTVRGISIR